MVELVPHGSILVYFLSYIKLFAENSHSTSLQHVAATRKLVKRLFSTKKDGVKEVKKGWRGPLQYYRISHF